MTSDVSAVETVNSKVIKNLQQIGEIQQCKVNSISFSTNSILNSSVNTKNKKWLDQQIDRNQKDNIDKKLSVHSANLVFVEKQGKSRKDRG